MEIIGPPSMERKEESSRFYSMTIGIKEYLCQIVDEDEHMEFEPSKDSKTHKETIKTFEPRSRFIKIKNIVWLLPTASGDAPIDYETLSTAAEEVVVNVSAIQKLNLLSDRVATEIAQEKRALKSGIVTPTNAQAELSSRKGGPNNVRK